MNMAFNRAYHRRRARQPEIILAYLPSGISMPVVVLIPKYDHLSARSNVS